MRESNLLSIETMVSAKEGNEAGLQQVMCRVAEIANKRARYVGFGVEDGEDIAQDVAFKVYKAISTYDPRKGMPEPWVWKIANRHIIDYHRKKERTWGRADHSADVGSLGYSQDIEYGLIETQNAELLRVALTKIRQDHAKKIRLQLSGLSFEEISENLNEPLGTVKSHMSRGKKRLKEQLINLGYSHF